MAVNARGLIQRLRSRALLLTVVLAIPAFALVEHIHRIEAQRSAELLRTDVLQHIVTMRARIEGELNASLFLSTGLVGYVAAYGDFLESDRVMTALEVIYGYGRYIRNVALAPDNLLQYVFPIEGNEAVIGLRYEDVPHQWPAVERAMQERETILAGPLDLIQGGRGLVSRTPVFTEPDQYWGLLTLVIDTDALFDELGLERHDEVNFGLRWQHPDAGQGDLIAGDRSVFRQSPVTQEISVPGGDWLLAATPTNGWFSGQERLKFYRLGGHLLVLALLVLVYIVIDERNRVARMALHDQLTGLPNRHHFKQVLRSRLQRAEKYAQRFALLYVDLDGFKAVNDHYGHGKGDEVLKLLSDRMISSLGPEHPIARIGGDEFIVMMPDVTSRAEARERIEPMLAAIRDPIAGLNENELLDATIGVAIYPDDGTTAAELLQNADRNMYQGKRRARSIPA